MRRLILLSVLLFACGKSVDVDPIAAVQLSLVQDISVTTTADAIANDGACSFREALRAASGITPPDSAGGCTVVSSSSDTGRVLLSAATYAMSIPPSFNGSNRAIDENAAANGDFDLPARGVEIVGAGSASTIISGSGLDRVLHAFGGTSGCAITISGVKVTGGCANGGNCETLSAGNYPANGGGFYDNSACALDLTNDVIFDGNHGSGGGGLAVCAISTVKPTAQLGAVVVTNNVGATGGGIEAHVPWRCEGCTISNNTAQWGGAVSQYAALGTLISPTLSGNTATGGGGGALLARGQSNGTTSGELLVSGGSCTNNAATSNGGCAYAGERGSWEHCNSTTPCRVTFEDSLVQANTSDTTGGPSGSGGGVAQGTGGLLELRGDADLSSNSDLSSPYAPDCAGTLHLYDQSTLGDATGCTVDDQRPPPGPVCGDGMTEGAEECDGGQCCTAQCVFAQSGSSCSDGDACTIGDECDAQGTCVAGGDMPCGDGTLQSACGETCDDGNTDAHDGCSPTCVSETCTSWE